MFFMSFWLFLVFSISIHISESACQFSSTSRPFLPVRVESLITKHYLALIRLDSLWNCAQINRAVYAASSSFFGYQSWPRRWKLSGHRKPAKSHPGKGWLILQPRSSWLVLIRHKQIQHLQLLYRNLERGVILRSHKHQLLEQRDLGLPSELPLWEPATHVDG